MPTEKLVTTASLSSIRKSSDPNLSMTNLQPIKMLWKEIDTVLLDMDGTLLDLHFDNYFWAYLVPEHYSKQNNLSLTRSKDIIVRWMADVQGTLDWYCIDYWDNKLNFDVIKLKRKVQKKIRFRPNALKFLEILKKKNKRIILATNAHPRAMELKFLNVDFSSYFDEISSSHELGYPKELQKYWKRLRERYEFSPESSLFIDDSQRILASADKFGIGYLLGIKEPDSKREPIDCSAYTGIQDFSQLF